MAKKRKPKKKKFVPPLRQSSETSEFKWRVIELATEYVDRFSPCYSTGMCLYWGLGVVYAGQKLGRRFVLQAGSAGWRRLPEELDDGMVATFFAYQWEGLASPAVQAAIHSGTMPEMHVWAADPITRNIIDLTTRFVPEQCEALTGLRWLMPRPPSFIWEPASKIQKLGHFMFYYADAQATMLALRMAERDPAGGVRIR